MKKQIICIHGGEVYESYAEYLADLQTFTVDPYVRQKKWRHTLQEGLGHDYEVFLPYMPNKMNAAYVEWELWFEKYFPFLQGEVTLIGHSLGGAFLLRYLSTHTLPVPVAALYLVAAPYFDQISTEGGDFRFDSSLLTSQRGIAQEVVLVHSKDDVVVPFSHFEKFKEIFKEGETLVFTDRGHFNQESFPELIEDIKRNRVEK